MSAIPGSVETDKQPPLTVPLRHFFVGLGFLCLALLVGIAESLTTISAFTGVASLHLLLAGWVCLTIMGAMTQFVPVWSGVELHSRRIANLQLIFVSAGLVGFAFALIANWLALLAGFGLVMLMGFWLFVYNLVRTFEPLGGLDVTERHFLFALGNFLVLTVFGVLLAVNLTQGVMEALPVSHGALLGAHMTLAVFGGVLTTIYGAIYQLGTMFTQTELRGSERSVQTAQEWMHYLGVILLAGGRLVEQTVIAQIGGILVISGALVVAVIIGRKLFEMQVEWTPMHRRYVVVVVSLAIWAVVSIPAWSTNPLAYDLRFGGPGTTHLLLIGVIGFVILGTLYHIIPFIIWINRYSDRLGFEKVPMIDDLYNSRVAAVEFGFLTVGVVVLVLSDMGVLSGESSVAGVSLFAIGVLLFIGNMTAVLTQHSAQSVRSVLFGSWSSQER